MYFCKVIAESIASLLSAFCYNSYTDFLYIFIIRWMKHNDCFFTALYGISMPIYMLSEVVEAILSSDMGVETHSIR